ncbi:hypothetical protein N9L68_08575, partial [bacterium]|nr:hypothetical protein [bacterium]
MHDYEQCCVQQQCCTDETAYQTVKTDELSNVIDETIGNTMFAVEHDPFGNVTSSISRVLNVTRDVYGDNQKLNTATKNELKAVPHIGKVLGDRLHESGPYVTWDEVGALSRIGPTRVKNLKTMFYIYPADLLDHYAATTVPTPEVSDPAQNIVNFQTAHRAQAQSDAERVVERTNTSTRERWRFLNQTIEIDWANRYSYECPNCEAQWYRVDNFPTYWLTQRWYVITMDVATSWCRGVPWECYQCGVEWRRISAGTQEQDHPSNIWSGVPVVPAAQHGEQRYYEDFFKDARKTECDRRAQQPQQDYKHPWYPIKEFSGTPPCTHCRKGWLSRKEAEGTPDEEQKQTVVMRWMEFSASAMLPAG